MDSIKSSIEFRLNFDTKNTKKNMMLVRHVMKHFHEKFLKWMTQDKIKSKLLKDAMQVIMQEIYEKYTEQTYVRTWNLLHSFKVAHSRKPDAEAHIWLYSDPKVAPSKEDPSLSYAAYFEKPEWHTFLFNRGQEVQPIRPFFDKLVEAFDMVIHTRILDFAEKALMEIERSIK